MRLIVQPEDGIAPLLAAIQTAKKQIQIAIFRFDHRDLERALTAAVARGVPVHALIAHTNQTGEKPLRRLELRLLAGGVTVSRTADDLLRYHDKLMIIDHAVLYVLGFNFTHQDIRKSRSFGVVTRNRKLVDEAVALFTADSIRQPYAPGLKTFIVSPLNARERLSDFLKGARRELLIYDPKLSDASMIRLLEQRARAGVTIKIIGRLSKRARGLQAERHPLMRLHVRAIVRDRERAFIGSQSLRALELEARREVGVITWERPLVRRLATVFDTDWARTPSGETASAAA